MCNNERSQRLEIVVITYKNDFLRYARALPAFLQVSNF